jgi:hypothetical protein
MSNGHTIRIKDASSLVVDDVIVKGDEEIDVTLVRERGRKIDVFYTDKNGQARMKEFWSNEQVEYYRSLEVID